MTQEPDDFSVEKPDIERNLRALLFEREAAIERLRIFAKEEQRRRHKAEEDRMNTHSEIERLTEAREMMQMDAEKYRDEAKTLRAAIGAEMPIYEQGYNDGLAAYRAEIERLKAAHSWQNICLAHQGDTQPCATPCLHCSRISAALEPKP